MAKGNVAPMVVALMLILIAIALAVYSIAQSRWLHLPTPTLGLALSFVVPILTLLSMFLPARDPARSITPGRHIVLSSNSPSLAPFGSHDSVRGWISQLFSRLPTQSQAQFLLSILSVLMLTLSASDLSRGKVLQCLLEERWREMFGVRDAQAVRGIQDALNCCGFRHPREWAWPFQGPGVDQNACLERYGNARDTEHGCEPGLEGRLRGVNAALVGAALISLLVQALIALANSGIDGTTRSRRVYEQPGNEGFVEGEGDAGRGRRVRYLDHPVGPEDETTTDAEHENAESREQRE